VKSFFHKALCIYNENGVITMTAKVAKGPSSLKGESIDVSGYDQPMSLGTLSALFNQQTSLFVKSEIDLIGG
jgi:hypothetical protein